MATSAASSNFAISALPISPSAIRSRQIPAAITLERDSESSPEDRFPDPLQKFWAGVLRGWLKDIVRRGEKALWGLTAGHLKDWEGLCMDIDWPKDTVPRMIEVGLKLHWRKMAGERVEVEF